MKRRTGLLFLAVAVIAVAVIGGLVLVTHSDSASTQGVAPADGNYSVAQAQGFSKFPLYDAGDTVNGLPMTGVEYDTKPADAVTFVYGDCMPPQAPDGTYDGGCPPPIQVQVWNACYRNPATYATSMSSAIGDKTTVRGAPAAWYEGGKRLEIQTGTSTVVIFADDPASVASELRGVNNSVPTGVDLPAPAKGAMDGTLEC